MKNCLLQIFTIVMQILKVVFPIISGVCFYIGVYNDIKVLIVVFGVIIIVYLRTALQNFSKPRQ